MGNPYIIQRFFALVAGSGVNAAPPDAQPHAKVNSRRDEALESASHRQPGKATLRSRQVGGSVKQLTRGCPPSALLE